MKTIVLASNNKHKIKEIKNILNVDIITMKDIGYIDDIIEDGNSFLENALIKARTISEYLKEKGLSYDVLADDSGLCCEALNGEPGIYSARYSGDHNVIEDRKKLLSNLDGKDRKAYFNCTLVLYKIDGSYQVFEGKTYGTITKEELGNKDFGYDCLFLSDDLNKTFGQASEDEKNSVSHRARALEKLKEYLDKE